MGREREARPAADAGFSLVGSGAFSGTERISGGLRTVVRDGHVEGFGIWGVRLSDGSRVEKLTVIGTGGAATTSS